MIPSDTKNRFIRRSVAGSEDNVGSSVIEIDQLYLHASGEIQPEEVEAGRANILEQIARFKKVLVLPDGVIKKIILFAVGPTAKLSSIKDDPRLSISQICARWRAIAFDTAEIWDIDMKAYSPLAGIRNADFFRLIGTWFTQCAGTRLSLKAHPDTFPWTDLPTQLLTHTIIPNSHHLRQLHLKVSSRIIRAILVLPSDTFTALEDLVLEMSGACTCDPFHLQHGPFQGIHNCCASPIRPATAFLSAPRLRTVQTNIWTLDHSKLQFPWSRLTEITFHSSGMSPIVCLNILSNCTSLVRCHIVFILDINAHPAIKSLSKKPVCLPTLKSLHLWLPDSDRLHLFLCSLKLPNLRDLTLRGGFGGWPDYIRFQVPDCTEFFRHFSSKLQVLTLEEGDAGSAVINFEPILKCTAHVQKATLRYGFPLQPAIMEKMANGVLLPCLEDINIQTNHADAVIAMLKTRQSKARASPPDGRPLSLLKKATINWVNCRHELTRIKGKGLGDLEDLQRQGLEIIWNADKIGECCPASV